MESLLALYALAHDPDNPIICFDERPCFLIGDVLEPVNMKRGQVKKEHYSYTKHGSCCLLAAIEPLTGNRLAHVRPQRTKKEYALFLRDLAACYPNAKRIHLVQDNLNTHNFGSLYEHFPADEAFELMQRFELHYTPKGASWLNMIEIEFSALSRLCLNRRIPTLEKLEAEVLTLMKKRTQEKIMINWQFSLQDARTKLQRHYENVNQLNSIK